MTWHSTVPRVKCAEKSRGSLCVLPSFRHHLRQQRPSARRRPRGPTALKSCGEQGRSDAESLPDSALRCCLSEARCCDAACCHRECIVEGEGKAKRSVASNSVTDEDMAWLKNTRWLWNNWREVILKGDGTFLAPAEDCESDGNPKCRWSAADDQIIVKCAPRATRLHRPVACTV